MKQRHTIRALLLLSGCGLGIALATPAAVAPLTAQEGADLIHAAASGDVFRLNAELPRIADPGQALLARARLAASRLDAADARRIIEQYLASPRTAHERALAWSIVADAEFAGGDYPAAARAAQAWLAALAEQGSDAAANADAQQMAVLAERLATATAQHTDNYAPHAEPLTHDKVGLLRAQVVINDKKQEAVLDTGANLSVVSLSTARKLGLRMLNGDASVASAASQAVPSRIGIADHLVFAGLSLSQVPFLVLDDAKLSMPVPGGYQIDAILGFPVLRQLQRLKFTGDGQLQPARSTASNEENGSLRMAGSDLYVNVMLNDSPVPMLLDSGASHSALSAAFAAEHPSLAKEWTTQNEHVAGAGGARTRKAAKWTHVQVRIGNETTILPALSVALESTDDAKEANVLGNDILHAFDSWTIDFSRMDFQVGAPLHTPDSEPKAR